MSMPASRRRCVRPASPRSRSRFAALALTAAASAAVPLSASAQSLADADYSALRYRHIGPDGNRAIAVVGEPGNPLVIYLGAASGGLWKSEDGATSWRPVMDNFDVSSISALAISDSEPNVLFAGTGETFLIRPAHAMGDGIYRTTDAGHTWEHKGLEDTGRIGRIRIDPRDADVAFACALGHAYGPQDTRGVHRTTDGGDTWEHVLNVSPDAGCIDLAMDPNNPRILYAAFWDIQIDTWMLDSGGEYSGLWRSRDGGDTWERLDARGTGLPSVNDQMIGKIAVEVAPSDPGRVYVLTEEESPRFYRSDDYGDTWALQLTNHTINERAPYYTRFNVDPQNPDRIYFTSVRFSMSVDGGKSLVERPPRGGGDTHDVWIDPLNAKRIMVADDGGLTISLNHGETFKRINLPIAQMYHVWVDDQIPYMVYGNRQDGWSYRGPSQNPGGFGIPLGLWQSVGGCESGWGIPDPEDPNIIWNGCYDGGLEIYDERTKQSRNVRVWPEASYGWAPKDLKYRWHWTFPIHISPHDHNRVYVGSQVVHVTEDQGQSWQIISPDLTLDLEDRQQSSGGVAIDNLMTFDGAVLFALAESPLEEGLIWAGTNDGQVQITRDGGANWTNLTANVPDLPPWGTIANIEPSRWAACRAYMTVDLHQMADFDPYIYRTEDCGDSWDRIDGTIPRSVHSFMHVVREDPKRERMLYAGTDNSVYFSLDDGEHWFPLRNNMPPAPVYWLTVQERFDDLVVGTYGRGFWIMDDVSPLRQLDADVLASQATLLETRDAWRFASRQQIKTESSFVTGRNPPYGADFNVWVGDDLAGQGMTVTVTDASGTEVRRLQRRAGAGLNRVWWDLRHERTLEPRLRVTPPDMPWVEMGPEGWRRLETWDLDLDAGQLGPKAVPGEYTVSVAIGDWSDTGTFTVLKDPLSSGTEADIAAQVAMSLEIRDEINETVTMINRIEWMRKQLEDIQTMMGPEAASDAGVAEVLAEVDRVMAVAIDVEGRLYDIKLTGAREDAFRNAMRLYGRLSALGADVGAFSADHPPTDQQGEVHEVLVERLIDIRQRFQVLMDSETDRLNEMLRTRKLPTIITDMPEE
jgi:photosystem II stability/assembly factor-like uncharacterized protein